MPDFTQGFWEPVQLDDDTWAVVANKDTETEKVTAGLQSYPNNSLTPTQEENEANSRLIAAAPRMYNLLKLALNVCHFWTRPQSDLMESINSLLQYIEGKGKP